MLPSFYPPTISTVLNRSIYNPPPGSTTEYVKHIEVKASRRMGGDVPVAYLDKNFRYARELPSAASLSEVAEDKFVDKYKTELFIDINAQALRSRYERSYNNMKAEKGKGKRGQYARQQLLKAGELSFYPGRQQWLIDFQRQRSYGLPSPQMHDGYGDFVKGVRNEEWVKNEVKVQKRDRKVREFLKEM